MNWLYTVTKLDGNIVPTKKSLYSYKGRGQGVGSACLCLSVFLTSLMHLILLTNLALVRLRRTGCDMWQMEYQAGNVTASVQSDQLLHGYMLSVFRHWSTASSTTLCWNSAHVGMTLPQLIHIAYWWYLICVKNGKRWKICAFYKVVRWNFSGVVGKTVKVCFLLR